MRYRKFTAKEQMRFWDKVSADPSGCWLWTGGSISKGYGLFFTGGKKNLVSILVHRAAYWMLVGEISEGLVLDHLCRVKNCVNPNHLEAVTQRVNSQRGLVGATCRERLAARKVCHKGHPYSQENTSLERKANGYSSRRCLVCKRERRRLRQIGAANPS